MHWFSPEEMGCKTYREYIEKEYGDKLIHVAGDVDIEIPYWGYGPVYGEPFTAWSEKWVYFPTEHDGAELVKRVPRNPCDIVTNHV